MYPPNILNQDCSKIRKIGTHHKKINPDSETFAPNPEIII